MITNIIIIDNFLKNINEVRKNALLLEYTKSSPSLGKWKGYRCLSKNTLATDLQKKIKNELIKNNTKFKNCKIDCFFHYTLEENNTGIDNIHKDTLVDYAVVLYMTPDPPKSSGTSFYNKLNIETDYLENVYNRLVIYSGNQLHSLKNAFGNNINNGRLTFTFFCTLKQKKIKTQKNIKTII
jgi:hypothetical protein